MSNEFSYYGWYPISRSNKEVVSIFLTRGACRRAPVEGRAFFEAVLSAAQVDATLLAWGVRPFYSSYFTGPGSWQECWEGRLLLTHKLVHGHSRRPVVVHVGISTSPQKTDEPYQWLPVVVLADFTSLDAARTCRAALVERNAAARWDDIHYDRFAIRDVGPRHKQLQIDVTSVVREELRRDRLTREINADRADRVRLQQVIPVADQVMAVCEQHGGRTHTIPAAAQ
jgi:hypothetical protein